MLAKDLNFLLKSFNNVLVVEQYTKSRRIRELPFIYIEADLLIKTSTKT